MNSFQKLKGAAKMKKKGFTLIELLVVIAIIAMLLAILMPALNKVKKIAQRVVCGTNLKGLGTAQAVYANDSEDRFVRQGGRRTLNWRKDTLAFDILEKDWSNPPALSVGASLYLLIREADVSPKSFVCGASGQTAYDGKNWQKNKAGAVVPGDLTALWDFGGPSVTTPNTAGRGPQDYVSYGYQNPFSQTSNLNGGASSSYAIMADKNPWFDNNLVEQDPGGATAENYTSNVMRLSEYYITNSTAERWTIQVANAYAHGREGQNVSFGDGHSEYCKTPDVGLKHDNIYTRKQTPYVNEASTRVGFAKKGLYIAPNPVHVGFNDPANESKYLAMLPADGDDTILLNDDDNK
jgi:prepilin-type N-terminal cleavage/methylation domain-containing protein